MKPKNPSLLLCVFLDIIGNITYILPAIGEFSDILWAPVSAIIFFKLFNSKIGATISFAEEIFPFTDFIPTFTIAWVLRYLSKPQASANKNLQLKNGF
ncbi:MAG: hypothetical protein JSR00_04995 [Bacteroidetes bacterium]|nr:hypothetical protein [Bacteroidota bacterium]